MNLHLAILGLLVTATMAHAETFVVQGSTTFNHQLLKPYQTAIEAASGHNLRVVPNKSSTGILALLEGRAQFAMISAPLAKEIAVLKREHPDLSFARLREFTVSRTRMAFAVNPENRVREATTEQMRQILLGKISHWGELGGDDQPIRLVIVREGGGVQASVEDHMLNGERATPAHSIRVQISSQVMKIVEQERYALGLAQIGLLRRANGTELVTDQKVTQRLSLVTQGEPTPAMREVIDAATRIAIQPSQ